MSNIKEESHADERSLFDQCGELVTKPSILDELEREIRKQGFAGPAGIPKLVYLTFVTGKFDKPVSLVIKGPSGSGKSFSLNAAIQFVPPFAYERYEGMSEKALVYLPGLDLKHKHLVIGEASGMADGNGRTLLRQLVSEGRVRYATVQSTDKGLVGSELPVLEGPMGLIMTTTATGLHPEDESRMLSVNITESREQIADALMAQALGTGRKGPQLNTAPWHALFELVRSGPKEVEIPFAGEIAKRLPTTHDRIKRDFPQVLSLIKAHALLHFWNRSGNGETVLANADDYAAVRELVNDALSQGLAVAVPDGIRSVVEGVHNFLHTHGDMFENRNGVSQATLSEFLNRDQSVISRNVSKAIEQGYLRNENPGQGREARLTMGDRKLPSGSVLPPVEELFPPKAAYTSPKRVPELT